MKTENIFMRATVATKDKLAKYSELLERAGIDKTITSTIEQGMEEVYTRDIVDHRLPLDEWELDQRKQLVLKYDDRLDYLKKDVHELIQHDLPYLRERHKHNNSKINILKLVEGVLLEMEKQAEEYERAVYKHIGELEKDLMEVKENHFALEQEKEMQKRLNKIRREKRKEVMSQIKKIEKDLNTTITLRPDLNHEDVQLGIWDDGFGNNVLEGLGI